MKLDVIYQGDCLIGMQRLPDASVDMIISDLPYGSTANQWDSLIPLTPLWEQYKRITKPGARIVLTCQQPFGSILISSNPKWFRCEWIWEKGNAVGFLNAKRHPLRAHENVFVFSSRGGVYNPQKTAGKPYTIVGSDKRSTPSYGDFKRIGRVNSDGLRYPRSVIPIPHERGLHPTQKPVALFEYFIKTYSNPGAVVLDSCLGSGTTAIACTNTGRHYIGFEKDPEYFQVARDRIRKHQRSLQLAKAA